MKFEIKKFNDWVNETELNENNNEYKEMFDTLQKSYNEISDLMDSGYLFIDELNDISGMSLKEIKRQFDSESVEDTVITNFDFDENTNQKIRDSYKYLYDNANYIVEFADENSEYYYKNYPFEEFEEYKPQNYSFKNPEEAYAWLGARLKTEKPVSITL